MGIRAERKKKRLLINQQKQEARFLEKKITLTKPMMMSVCRQCEKHYSDHNDYSCCSQKSRQPIYISDGSQCFLDTLKFHNVDLTCDCQRLSYIMLVTLKKH